MFRWFSWCLALVLLVVGLGGCARPKYTVTGKVTRDGKPLEWKSDAGVLDVKFVPLDRERDRNVYRCEGDPKTGAYILKGIPPGSYRVSIQQMDPYPTHDLLNFALNMAESPLICDVTRNGEVIDLDIPRNLSRQARRN